MARAHILLRSLICWSSIFVVATLAFSGCGSLCPGSTSHPDVEKLGAEKLAIPEPSGVIDLIAPFYTSTSNEDKNASQILFSQDGKFFTERLNDHALKQLDLTYDCARVAALAPDHASLACVAHAEACQECGDICTTPCLGDSIVSASLLPGEIGQEHELVPQQEGVNLGALSWAPDQKHLAAFQQRFDKQGKQSCSLAIYSAQPNAQSLALTALIPLASLYTCEIAQVLWSPDGAYIAFVTWDDSIVSPNTSYVIPVSSFPSKALTVHSQPMTLNIAPKAVFSLGPAERTSYIERPHIAWMPDGKVLSMTIDAGHTVIEVDVANGDIRKTLALSSDLSFLEQLAWGSDNRSLFFSIYNTAIGFCGAPNNELYTYESPPFYLLPIASPSPEPTQTPTPAPTERPIPVPTWTPAPPTPAPTAIV